MSYKDIVIECAGILAIELDTLAAVMADLRDKFNAKVDEANSLLDQLQEDVVDEDEYVEPMYLVELDWSDDDPAGYGDDLRQAVGLQSKSPAPYAAPDGTPATVGSTYSQITDDQFAENKAKAELTAAERGITDQNTGKLFDLDSYRYFVVGFEEGTGRLLGVRARNGDLHFFEGERLETVLEKLGVETKPVL